ncbi:lateral flagellin LafA [Vibrio breoganii]
MISVHTNYASLVTQNTLAKTNDALTTSMERLATGKRVNSAADDAAGLQIASRLEAQSRGMAVASRNSQDAISMMQTAEGAMDEMASITMRMKDLATQAANGTNGANEFAAIDSEYQELKAELNNVLDNTNYGGVSLLKGGSFAGGAVTFQIGATAAETLNVDVSTELGAIDAAVTGLGAITDQATAQAELAAFEAAGNLIDSVGSARAGFGANVNRLDHTINNLANMQENLTAAKGRIVDTDFAKEAGEMSKQQMLMQSGSSMLGATKMVPQLALGLLG